MKDLMRRLKLDRWIADGAPAFWVLGMSILFCVAALGILSALCLFFEWSILRMAISCLIVALTVSMLGLLAWFVVDALTAKERPKPWRR